MSQLSLPFSHIAVKVPPLLAETANRAGDYISTRLLSTAQIQVWTHVQKNIVDSTFNDECLISPALQRGCFFLLFFYFELISTQLRDYWIISQVAAKCRIFRNDSVKPECDSYETSPAEIKQEMSFCRKQEN